MSVRPNAKGRCVEVSYVVPAYDAAESVGDAVRSALAQEGVSLEVVVVDDGSRDATAEVVAALAREDERVRLVRLARNGGVSRARNAGIAQARGRFVGVLDADDMLLPGRTRTLLETAETLGADIVADNLERVDAAGRLLAHAFPARGEPFAFAIGPARYLDDNAPMLARFASGYLKPLFCARRLARLATPYDPQVPIGEDFLLCLELMLDGARYLVSSIPGYRYVTRPGSASHRLTTANVEALVAGTERLRARRADAIAREPELAAAFDAYRARLARVHAFLGCVEEAKIRGLARGGARAAGRPETWSLVARYGVEAIGKRLAWRHLPAEGAATPAMAPPTAARGPR